QVMYGKPLADLLAQVETQLHQELQPSRGEGRPALSESQLALLQKASAAVAELRAASAEMARGGTAAVTVKSDLAAASTPVPGEGAGGREAALLTRTSSPSGEVQRQQGGAHMA